MALQTMRFLPVVLFAALGGLAKHGEGGGNEDDANTSAPVTPPPSTLPATPTSPPVPAPSSVSPFQFLTMNNATTCQNTTIKWMYTATDDVLMTIAITNGRATGVQSPTSQNGTTLVSRTLTDTISSKAQQVLWSSVDVQEGSYVAVAFDTNGTAGIFATSSPFFVLDGQDMSCLNNNNTSPSGSGVTTSSPSPTTNTGSSASQGATPNPASLATQPKALSSGALAGTVVGVVIGVILLLIAFSFPHLWRHSLPKPSRSRRPGGPYLLF